MRNFITLSMRTFITLSLVAVVMVAAISLQELVFSGDSGEPDRYLFYDAFAPLRLEVNLDDQVIDPAMDFELQNLTALGVPTDGTTVGFGYGYGYGYGAVIKQHEEFHLTTYKIKGPKVDPKITVRVTDDFSTVDVVVRKLERLLVPATKQSGQAPPAPTISDINTLDLDHYTCYNIKPLDKFDHILGVFVRDQCTDSKAIMIQKPSRLCTAVDKGGDGVGLQNPDALLMCYQVKMAPGVKKNPRVTDIWVADQFFDEGTELGKKLRTTLPKEACIPATAQIL